MMKFVSNENMEKIVIQVVFVVNGLLVIVVVKLKEDA